MKVNFIIQGFPESVVIDGGEYPINWDFRVWMQFEDIKIGRASCRERV